MTLLIWQDDAWRQAADAPAIHADDGGWLFGDSLFETLLVREGRALLLKDHLDRLELSARLLELPFARQDATDKLQRALGAAPWPVARLRLTLSRGATSGLGFPSAASRLLLSLAPYREASAAERQTGWHALTAPNRRVNPLSHLPQLKRGNYADCLYAWNHARRNNRDEALFAEPTGELLEGATSNLFVVRAGRLVTPPAGELVLAGVVRGRLLELAAGLGLSAAIEPLGAEQLFGAEEAFLCNSLVLMMPLASLDGRPVPRGTRWQALLEALEARCTTADRETP